MRSLIWTIAWKELREIRRDPVTIAVAAVLPLLMLYLFGAARRCRWRACRAGCSTWPN